MHVITKNVSFSSRASTGRRCQIADAHLFHTGWRWLILTSPNLSFETVQNYSQPVVQLYLPGTDPTPSQLLLASFQKDTHKKPIHICTHILSILIFQMKAKFELDVAVVFRSDPHTHILYCSTTSTVD